MNRVSCLEKQGERNEASVNRLLHYMEQKSTELSLHHNLATVQLQQILDNHKTYFFNSFFHHICTYNTEYMLYIYIWIEYIILKEVNILYYIIIIQYSTSNRFLFK